VGTKMKFDSGNPGTRSPYLGRHRKALASASWRLVRRGQEGRASQAESHAVRSACGAPDGGSADGEPLAQPDDPVADPS